METAFGFAPGSVPTEDLLGSGLFLGFYLGYYLMGYILRGYSGFSTWDWKILRVIQGWSARSYMLILLLGLTYRHSLRTYRQDSVSVFSTVGSSLYLPSLIASIVS